MKSVNIAELKNRLSVYLNEVKAGEEILVRDRNQPVARIVPLARSRNEDDELLALASQGKLRLGGGGSRRILLENANAACFCVGFAAHSRSGARWRLRARESDGLR